MEKNFTEKDSLDVIRQMIQLARHDHTENGDGWLIWGWLLFGASVISVVFMHTGLAAYIHWVWECMLATGLIVYILTHLINRKRQRVKTYIQELLDKLETGFFISLFMIIAGSALAGMKNFSFGYYYILYAFWMFIHGSAIRFKPLLVGAFVNWAAAIAIFLIDDFSYDMTISALAVLIGYLVPGYMLKSEYKRKLTKENSGDGV